LIYSVRIGILVPHSRYLKEGPILFKVVDLLIFKADDGPLRAAEQFCKAQGHDEELGVEDPAGEEDREEGEDPEETEEQIRDHCIVVEPGWEEVLISKAPGAWLPGPEEAPVHVEVPIVGVAGGKDADSDEDLEGHVILDFVLENVCKLDQDRAEILACIP
jgi:hypothetical protein